MFAANNKPNLFTSMVTNKYLKTNSVPEFDSFIASPDLNTLQGLNKEVLQSVYQLEQFNAKFLILFLSVLAKVYNESSKKVVLNCAGQLCDEFFKNSSNLNTFPDEFLTQLGFLKVSLLNVCIFTYRVLKIKINRAKKKISTLLKLVKRSPSYLKKYHSATIYPGVPKKKF